jgi:citrate lyase subunit beta / citryl-CoA lyase
MRLRSLLFVPGDRPERMTKALGSGADAIILDLEDSVAPPAKEVARREVVSFLQAYQNERLLVRINPLDAGLLDLDIAAVRTGRPKAVMLPKSKGAKDIDILAKHLPDGMRILPISAETPSAIFSLGSFADVSHRLCGLTWGAEDLASGVGAQGARSLGGALKSPFRLARDLTLFAAHAAEIPAIETVYADFRDLNGLSDYASQARQDGFSGMMAIHPSQVGPINLAFTPSADELDAARAIVAAFAANPGVGALSLNGKMIDRPHLKRAENILRDYQL